MSPALGRGFTILSGLRSQDGDTAWLDGLGRVRLVERPFPGFELVGMSMRHSLVPLLTAATIAFGFAFAGSTAANAESVMKECASQWKAAEAAGTTGGQTWPQFLSQCRTRESSAAAPPSGTFAPAPAPAPPQRPRRPRSQAPSSRGGSHRLRLPRPRRTPARPRPRGQENTRPNWRRAPAARPTPLCGSTPRRASITIRGPTIMGIPSAAPTCARPTRERPEIARRARSSRPIRDKRRIGGADARSAAFCAMKEKPRQRGVAPSGA